MTRADGMVAPRRRPRCYLGSVAVGQPARRQLAAQHYFSMRDVLVVVSGQPAARAARQAGTNLFLCDEFGSGAFEFSLLVGLVAQRQRPVYHYSGLLTRRKKKKPA